nr:hypothetical protein 14 [bacterium]
MSFLTLLGNTSDYDPNALWIKEYPLPLQVAIHSGKLKKSQVNASSLGFWVDGDDASTIIKGTGNLVREWQDKSGKNRHAVQADSNRQPTTGLVTLNGKNGVFFDATKPNHLLSNWVPSGDNEYTIFVVAKRIDNSTPNIGGSSSKVILSAGSMWTYPVFGIAEWRDNIDWVRIEGNGVGADFNDVSEHLTGAVYCFNTYMNGGNRHTEFYINSTNKISAYAAPVTPNETTLQLGNHTSYDSRAFYGTIFEVVVYQEHLSELLRQQVETYLLNKWGLS